MLGPRMSTPGSPMKLHWSPRSPFVRKVMVVVHELGLADRITCVRTVAATTKPHAGLMQDNPLSKIPTLVLDDGTVIYDSPVICEYLDTLAAPPKLFPAAPVARFTALRRQALGDGFLEMMVLLRDERMRSPPSDRHIASTAVRKAAVLQALEAEAAALSATPFGIGHIAFVGALPYLVFRFSGEDWLKGLPRFSGGHVAFAARPSVPATEPVYDA